MSARDHLVLLRRWTISSIATGRRALWAVRPGERSLDDLALWYGADKCSAGHGFAKIYESHVAPLRNQSVTLIEIGVFRGASLRMWRDYFPRGRIFGVDILPDAIEARAERIEVFVGDQSDPALLGELLAVSGSPDIVVDDGAHRVDLQLASLAFLWPHLKPGGLYVIEDTHTSYLEGYGMGWRQPGSTIEELKNFVDDLHRGWHEEPVVFDDLECVHFYRGTCVLRKSVAKSQGERRRRLNAAAASRTGHWAGG